MIVVEARLDGTFLPLVREKETLRLGDRVAKSGVLGEEGTSEALEVITRFIQIAQASKADEVIAVGTAAIREANDGAAFVDRVRTETGVEITVVDGRREAELIFTAVRSSVLIDPGPALAADLGGGSLELIVGDRTEIAYAASVPIGVGRLTTAIENDPLKDSDLRRLRKVVAEALDPVIDEIVARGPKQFIVSSGTFLALVRMAAARQDGTVHEIVNQLSVGREVIEELAEDVCKLPRRGSDEAAGLRSTSRRAAARRRRRARVPVERDRARRGDGERMGAPRRDRPRRDRRARPRRAARRPAGAPALVRAFTVSPVELAPAARPSGRLARRAAVRRDRGSSTRLGPDERELLEFSAYLHDIGEHISRRGPRPPHRLSDRERGSARLFPGRGPHPRVDRPLPHPRHPEAELRGVRRALRGRRGAGRRAHRDPAPRRRARRLAPRDRAGDRGVAARTRPHADDRGRTRTPTPASSCGRARRKQELFERIFGVEFARSSAAATPRAAYRQEGSGSGFG